MTMQLSFLHWFVLLICWNNCTSTKDRYADYGSMLVFEPLEKYEIKEGTIFQTLQHYKDCDESEIKYTWNGSHFLIGPILSNYHGQYNMGLQNISNIWENHTFSIIVKHKPEVESKKVIVDQGDSINLTCTYKSNCNTKAWWTKDELNELFPVYTKRLGKTKKSIIYILEDIQKYFADKHFCFPSKDDKNYAIVELDVKDFEALGISKPNDSNWFEEDSDASINFSIFGSPLPNLTCIHEKTKEKILSCSKRQMEDIFYRENHKPCKSENGRYILSSRGSLTKEVKLSISKVKVSKNDGVLLCHLMNSREQPKNFNLTVNVKEKYKKGDNKKLFIAIGCSLALLMIVVIAFVLYIKERNRNNTYKRFFMAHNNYTIDPLKTLNEQMHNLSYDEDWEFPYKYLEFNELIGCGAFGKVYKAKAYGIGMMNSRDKSAQAKKQRKQLNKAREKTKLLHCEETECLTVAVKTTKDNPNVNDIRNLAGELKMIIHVGQHENIVNVLGACTKYPKLYMIIEYCPHGSLLDFLRDRREVFQPTWLKEDFASKERFTIAQLVSTALQVCNGMKFLASMKCIHRDLAARNVLVAENYVMKVADFGLAREIVDTDNNYISNTQSYLPVKWLALESILQKVYNEESDVWSFGILLWEMFTLGQTPYPSIPVQNLVQLLIDSVRMEKPYDCPDEIYNIMLECWNENPKERPTFKEIYTKFEKLTQDNACEDTENDDWDDSSDGGFRKETEIL